jgi:hypothetical protein
LYCTVLNCSGIPAEKTKNNRKEWRDEKLALRMHKWNASQSFLIHALRCDMPDLCVKFHFTPGIKQLRVI